MKTGLKIKPILLTLPIALAAFGATETSLAAGLCDTPAANPFKVVVSVTNDGMGNPVVNFQNYTVGFSPDGGKAPSPIFFVCLGGQATFDPGKENITWDNNPGDFSVSDIHNPNPDIQVIIRNTNQTKGEFHYFVTVQTKDFGEMVIDPRVLNGGGGTVN